MIKEIYKLYNDSNCENYAGFVAYDKKGRCVAAQDCDVGCNNPYDDTQTQCASCNPIFGGHPAASSYIDKNGIMYGKKHYTLTDRNDDPYLHGCFYLKPGEERCHWSYGAEKFTKEETIKKFHCERKNISNPEKYGFFINGRNNFLTGGTNQVIQKQFRITKILKKILHIFA
jgi:hypothetical protein